MFYLPIDQLRVGDVVTVSPNLPKGRDDIICYVHGDGVIVVTFSNLIDPNVHYIKQNAAGLYMGSQKYPWWIGYESCEFFVFLFGNKLVHFTPTATRLLVVCRPD